jgi:hypothetical protein
MGPIAGMDALERSLLFMRGIEEEFLGSARMGRPLSAAIEKHTD